MFVCHTNTQSSLCIKNIDSRKTFIMSTMIYSFNYDELLNPEWSKRPFSSIIIGNNNGYAALGYGEFGNGE